MADAEVAPLHSLPWCVLGKELLPGLRLAAVQSRGFYVNAVSTSPEPATGTWRRICSAPCRPPFPDKASRRALERKPLRSTSGVSAREEYARTQHRSQSAADSEAPGRARSAPAWPPPPKRTARCSTLGLRARQPFSLNASAHSWPGRALTAPDRARNAPAFRKACGHASSACRAKQPRRTRAVCAPRVRRNATMRQAGEARGSAPSSAIRGSPDRQSARAQHAARVHPRRAALRTRQRTVLGGTQRGLTPHWEGAQRSVESRCHGALSLRARTQMRKCAFALSRSQRC